MNENRTMDWRKWMVVVAVMLPDLGLLVFTSDAIPEAWRYAAWPGTLRIAGGAALAVSVLAQVVLTIAFFTDPDCEWFSEKEKSQ